MKTKLAKINEFVATLDRGTLTEPQNNFLFHVKGAGINIFGCVENPKCENSGCTINQCPVNPECLYPNPATSCKNATATCNNN